MSADIVIRNVSKRYSKASDSGGVFDVNATLPGGKFTTLLGESGSGKTTLLRLLAGFLRPDEGEIVLGNNTVASDDTFVAAQKRDLAMVFQSYALWPHMDVFENVAFGLRAQKLPKEAIRERVAATLRLVDLEKLQTRKPANLSGGQQQRVALARSIVLEPELLLLDEPLSNLDADLRLQMRNELRTLQVKTGITFVYVTHDQEEAFALSDNMIVLDQGRILQQGSSRDIYTRPRNRRVAQFMGRGGLHLRGSIVDGPAEKCGFVMRENLEQPAVNLGTFSYSDPDLSPGAAARLVAHSEDLSLCAPSTALDDHVTAVPGVVKTVNFAGREDHIDVQLDSGAIVTVYEATDHAWSVGQRVNVGFERDSAWIFKSEGSSVDEGSADAAVSASGDATQGAAGDSARTRKVTADSSSGQEA